jgi:FkbM family methyltransferase
MPVDRAPRTYFAPFCLMLAGVVALSVYAWRTHTELKELRNQRPWTLAKQRDKNYSFVVDAYGYKYQGETGNLIDEEVLVFGAFEKERLFFMRDYLTKCGVEKPIVLDVGANTGHHSLFLSRHAARVHAFEPFPPVIQKFKHNLSLNPGIENIVLHEVGLGNEKAELPFVEPPDDNHGNGTFSNKGSITEHRAIHTRKLQIVVGDEWLRERETGAVALVKVDVEGFEESVLIGLRKTLERHRPLTEVEVTPTSANGTIGSLDRLRELFPENYEFEVLEGRNTEGALKGVYALKPLTAGDFGTGRQLEVVAYPKERKNQLPR